MRILESADELERAIEEAFRDNGGKSLLLSYTMDYSDVKPLVNPIARSRVSP